MSSDRRYTQEEVDAILKRALERDDRASGDRGALSHQDLLETAKEVGIEASQVERAITEVKQQGDSLTLQGEWKQRRAEAFRRGALTWAFVSALCTMIWFLSGAGYVWPLWVAGPWGLLLAFRYFGLSQGPSRRELDQLQEKLDREERKRQLAANFERGAKAVSQVVEQGANLLLAHLDDRARRIEGRSERDGNKR